MLVSAILTLLDLRFLVLRRKAEAASSKYSPQLRLVSHRGRGWVSKQQPRPQLGIPLAVRD